MGLKEDFIRLTRKLVGLPEEPGAPPELLLLGRYRCTVEAVNADRTLDLRPEDSRIAARQSVKLRQPFPGVEVTAAVGDVVLMGWERGDRARPYAVPEWEDGATLQKLVMNAVAMYLGGEAGALPAARKTDTVAAGTTMAAWIAATQTLNETVATLVSLPAPVAPSDFGVIDKGSPIVNIK